MRAQGVEFTQEPVTRFGGVDAGFRDPSGNGWKLTSPAQTVPALQAIPQVVWQALTPIDLLCSVGLILAAFNKRLAILAPISAACIATEMLLFCGVYMAADHADLGQLIYWLVVAAICAFFAYGRRVPLCQRGVRHPCPDK